MRDNRSRRCRSVRFSALADFSEGLPAELDRRLLLSAVPAHHHAVARPAAHSEAAKNANARVTPKQEIINQYNLFRSNLNAAESSYIQSLEQQSTGTVTVSSTLTAPYTAGSASMQVANAALFGPVGTYSSTLFPTAQIGGVTVGSFAVTGSAITNGMNLLAINTAQSSNVSLAAGTTLTAQVTSSAATSAQSIFPSLIQAGTNQLAVNLVAYFNSLTFKLPRYFALPHNPARGGAIQGYVYEIVNGTAPTTLRNTLTAISLPQTQGGDYQLYQSAVNTDIQASENQMLSAVQQIFSGKLQVVYSVPSNSTSSSGSGSTSTSSSSSSSNGSSSSGAA